MWQALNMAMSNESTEPATAGEDKAEPEIELVAKLNTVATVSNRLEVFWI